MLVALVFCLGCSSTDKIHDIILSEYPDEFEYIKYDQGREFSKRYVEKGDPEYDKLLQLISSADTGWQRDYITYAPKDIFVSPRMCINIVNDIVIINCNSEANKMGQVIRKVDREIINGILNKNKYEE